MSLRKYVFPSLGWGEIVDILEYLSLRETWCLGTTCRSAFITFMRQRSLLEGSYSPKSLVRFLPAKSNHGKVLLVSYPRSGNSFLRSKLESMTGIVTGSDSRPNRPLTSNLLKFGYKGEGIVDNSVWVVKSHFPERLGYIRSGFNKVILLVRNPFDAIESYFHMAMTITHNKRLTNSAFASLEHIWKEFVINEAKVWENFHRIWIEKALENKFPIIIVRYEDLMGPYQEATLQLILKFMMHGAVLPLGFNQSECISKFNVADKLERCRIASETAGYTPAVIQRKDGKSLVRYSIEQLTEILSEIGSFLTAMGYSLTSSLDTEHDSYTKETTTDQQYLKVDDIDVRTLIDLIKSAEPLRTAISESDSKWRNVGKCCVINPLRTHDVREVNTETVSKETKPKELAYEAPQVFINDHIGMRPEDDKFGRKVTELRRSMTANDTIPFETL